MAKPKRDESTGNPQGTAKGRKRPRAAKSARGKRAPHAGACGVPPPPNGGGGGRRKGYVYLTSREAIEKAASKIVNEFLEARRRKVVLVTPDGTEEERITEVLDAADVNALTGMLRVILDSKKFSDTVAVKLRDDTLKRELDEAVGELEAVKELLVERGILTKNGDPIH